ncbi:ATP-binding protein [Neobacillus vireti]|uniref:ATP-binding protein n=1 Tax=Neobacillus vireti TaxID=220686 RepID=UPI002FFE6A1B
MRDVITIPLHGEESLIIATDNSGSIGRKEQDQVKVSYETVAYYSFRVAVMECIAAGGKPFSVVLHNFCGNDAWGELVKGIKKGLKELNLQDVPITGSTESNFHLQQSAIGVVVLGKKQADKETELHYSPRFKLAVIGSPLVGNEVVDFGDQVAPLSIFWEVSSLRQVNIWPVGSKGILNELNQMFRTLSFAKDDIGINLDVLKSSGPSTCFIVVFEQDQEEEIKSLAAGYFHPLSVNR